MADSSGYTYMGSLIKSRVDFSHAVDIRAQARRRGSRAHPARLQGSTIPLADPPRGTLALNTGS